MKRTSFVTICNLLLLYFSVSCTQLNQNNINVTVSESEQYYEVLANYNSNNSKHVDKYLNKHLGKANNMSFSNTRIDGHIAME